MSIGCLDDRGQGRSPPARDDWGVEFRIAMRLTERQRGIRFCQRMMAHHQPGSVPYAIFAGRLAGLLLAEGDNEPNEPNDYNNDMPN